MKDKSPDKNTYGPFDVRMIMEKGFLLNDFQIEKMQKNYWRSMNQRDISRCTGGGIGLNLLEISTRINRKYGDISWRLTSEFKFGNK